MAGKGKEHRKKEISCPGSPAVLAPMKAREKAQRPLFLCIKSVGPGQMSVHPAGTRGAVERPLHVWRGAVSLARLISIPSSSF